MAEEIPTAAWWHHCGSLNAGDFDHDNRVCSGCRHEVRDSGVEVTRLVVLPAATAGGIVPAAAARYYGQELLARINRVARAVGGA